MRGYGKVTKIAHGGKAINPFRVLHKIIKISNGVNRTVKIVKNIKNLSKALPYREKRVYNTLTKISPKNSKPFVWKDLKNKIDIKIAKREKNDNRIKLSSAKGDA